MARFSMSELIPVRGTLASEQVAAIHELAGRHGLSASIFPDDQGVILVLGSVSCASSNIRGAAEVLDTLRRKYGAGGGTDVSDSLLGRALFRARAATREWLQPA